MQQPLLLCVTQPNLLNARRHLVSHVKHACPVVPTQLLKVLDLDLNIIVDDPFLAFVMF